MYASLLLIQLFLACMLVIDNVIRTVISNVLFSFLRLQLNLKNYCPAPITTTRPAPTTTIPPPQPAECQSAINLTEYWRKDHSGSNIKPIDGDWNCDKKPMIDAGRPWFRFTGAAGNRLLNHCVRSADATGTSCGTGEAIWSDASMPTEIGVVTKFSAFGSYNGICKRATHECSVMRCSDQQFDLIYRYDDSDSSCNDGFCGMD